jgi:hypothetical protein
MLPAPSQTPVLPSNLQRKSGIGEDFYPGNPSNQRDSFGLLPGFFREVQTAAFRLGYEVRHLSQSGFHTSLEDSTQRS